jgi:cell division protease FtsH
MPLFLLSYTREKMNQTQEPKRPMPRIQWLWWVLLLALAVWNILLFFPQGQPQVNLAYSVFLAQVNADNVARVHITGDQITGTFVKPYAPPAPSAAAPSNPPTPLQTYTDFRTTFPALVGDSALMPLLQTHSVMVDVSSPSTPWFITLLTDGLPVLLLVGVLVWMGRQAAQQQSGIFGFGRSRPRSYVGDRPQVTFNDVADAEEAKSDLQEVVDFLQHPQKYHDLGARIPRGILLVGPPGTGKTLLARAVAGEANVPFFNISASEFVEMFVGVGASRVRDLFEQAKAAAPAIVFIDELDAVGRRRGAGVGAVNDEREQTLNQLLVEMDGFDERHEVILLAATNRSDVLDPALLRPGRFDRQIVVALPDRQGREGILKIHTRGLHLAADVDLALLARTTTGLSGADLANLANEAALTAARHNHTQVALDDFEEALDKILLGGVRPLLLDAHERRVVAYHEAGHALVAWLTPNADPVRKITIIPHGRALGVTTQLPADDHYNYSRAYLLARLAVLLGGRVAEEIALDDVTTGAENDLVEATRLARHMVTRWAMGELGLVAFEGDEEQPFLGYELAQGHEYSEATAARVDVEVERLLSERHGYVRQLLAKSRDKLEQLVQTLLHEETIDEAGLQQLLGARTFSEPMEALSPQQAETRLINDGKEKKETFTAPSQTGTNQSFRHEPGHKEAGMVGNLIVK